MILSGIAEHPKRTSQLRIARIFQDLLKPEDNELPVTFCRFCFHLAFGLCILSSISIPVPNYNQIPLLGTLFGSLKPHVTCEASRMPPPSSSCELLQRTLLVPRSFLCEPKTSLIAAGFPVQYPPEVLWQNSLATAKRWIA
jgi:hypothetical protein